MWLAMICAPSVLRILCSLSFPFFIFERYDAPLSISQLADAGKKRTGHESFTFTRIHMDNSLHAGRSVNFIPYLSLFLLCFNFTPTASRYPKPGDYPPFSLFLFPPSYSHPHFSSTANPRTHFSKSYPGDRNQGLSHL